MHRQFVLALAAVLVGCPAEGPLQLPDMSSETDMGPTLDMPGVVVLTLDAVSPSEGPLEGGTVVTLSGTGFEDGMTVRFGSNTAVDASVTSTTEATATTPSSTVAGSVTVVISTPDGESDSLQGGFTYTGMTRPAVEFCQLQAQSPAFAIEGEATEVLYALVFAEGVTNGEGQGAGIEGELGWGSGAAFETFTYVAMDYNVDVDGLSEGDLANDEYGAALIIGDGGTYRYAARFRIDDGDWVYCDLDGSENGIDEDQLGVVEVREIGELVDACNLQFPNIIENGQIGGTITYFGRVSEAGLTGSSSAHPAIVGELFVGPPGVAAADVDPASDFSSFTSVPARLSTNAIDLAPGEDEYVATFAAQNQGERVFGFRFSADAGTTWSYCGLQDDVTPSGVFAPVKLGAFTATATPDTIDFCHVWEETLDDDVDTSTLPLITVEVFEDPLTVGNGGVNSDQLEVEAAAVPLEENPAWSDVAWNPLAFKDLRPGEPNNYEYEGNPYTAATHPAAGSFNVVARVRRAGTTIWTYCDVDEAAARFRLSAATRLTVTP